jgi:hypothetical protein
MLKLTLSIDYHFFLIDLFDVVQSVLILISALFIIKHMKTKMTEMSMKLQNLTSELSELKCLKKQTTFLASSYLCFIILDLILMKIANYMYDDNFECLNMSVVRAIDNLGSLMIFLMAISILLFSLMMWYIFYKIPDQ